MSTKIIFLKAEEFQARAVDLAVNTLKAFGKAEHILTVSDYTRDTVTKQVQLVAGLPILINSAVKEDLSLLFASDMSTSKVFKQILQGLLDPDKWLCSTPMFHKQHEATIAAAFAFLRAGRPNDKYDKSKAKDTIRNALSDMKKKRKKGILKLLFIHHLRI
jgi:hypothetical protein